MRRYLQFCRGKAALLTALLIMFSLPLFAQLSQGGLPLSSTTGIVPEEIPVIVVPPPDPGILSEEDRTNDLPYRFAVNLPVEEREGVWEELPGGEKAWFLTIASPGALALTLYFDRFRLPPGGRLFVYTQDRSSLLGAFTWRNNTPSETFATGLVPGDKLTLEYNHPASGEELPQIRVNEIAYVYRGFPVPGPGRGFGSSGPCEVNVNCPEGDNWQSQKKGVMRIGVKKGAWTYWCSGSLVNNTRLDHTPYVLTADHCGQGATEVDITKWLFYFDFESHGCPNPSSAPSFWSLTGATLKATSGDVQQKGSDFFLLLLNDTIPDTAGVWFNGWNRKNIGADQGTGIHHPQGDIKKISTYTSPLVSSYWGNPAEETHWEVHWASTISGHGVTEGGSSGSPLFDASGRIVGVLTGGEASCDSSALELPDYYGKFSWSWDRNGPSPEERLDHWLDPDNTGVEVLNGIPLTLPEPVTGARGIELYPNPVSDMLNIRFEKLGLQDIHVTLFDARGIMVWENRYNAFDTENLRIDLSALPDGFYLVTILSDGELFTGRVIRLTE